MILLDTCALLWLAAGLAPRPGVAEAVEAARAEDGVLVSPISAWEIAQKEKRRPGALGLTAPALAVFQRIAASPGFVWRRFLRRSSRPRSRSKGSGARIRSTG